MVIDGERFIDRCPVQEIGEEAWTMIACYNDFDAGHTPVTMGRAPWLPSPFVQAMHAIRHAVNDGNTQHRKRLEEKNRPRGPHGRGG